MIKCWLCDLELIESEVVFDDVWQDYHCKDRKLCEIRQDNAGAKRKLMENLKRAEESPLETPAIVESMLRGDCEICGEKPDHEYHNAERCSWCRKHVRMVPAYGEHTKIVDGWCPECHASWLMEIEKEMR